ncbi:MAG TPA: PASTA domain-containing protein [Actinomycetes bacterium]|nr:PASTA domain-containing protein [Actinomycetes bacterium]
MAKRSTDVDRLVGRTLGRRRYAVVARIAQGGMATVYRAHDRQLDRAVAVKVPRPEFARDRAFCEQFRREARAAARLAHPNVVAVHDSGEERGLPWIVMEYVDGQTLRALLEARGRLDLETTAELLGEVADALDHAHRHGIAHLDVKPENVLITSDSVKVADFGLARAAQGARDHALAGTALYCAPEVLRGGAVDGHADVYSLGVVAYECLTGRAPFGAGDVGRVTWQVLHSRVPVPSRAVPGIPETADVAVRRATEPDPARRFARASDLAAAIGAPRRRVDQALLATSPPPSQPPLPSSLDTVVTPPSRAADTRVSVPDGRAATSAGWRVPARPTTGQVPRPRPPRRGRRHGSGWIILVLVLAVLLSGGALLWDNVVASAVPAPNLVGQDLDRAKDTLRSRHLKFTVAEPVASRTVPEGMVAEQSPRPGASVRRRGAIRLTPSLGIILPALKGQDPAKAGTALDNLGLRWRKVPAPSLAVDAGLVAGTRPRAGTPIGRDRQVEVLVSTGKPQVQVPGVNGRPADRALEALRAAHLEPRTVKVFDARVPAGQVIAVNPPPGLTVSWGTTVRVYVSKGPELVPVPDVVGRPRAQAEALLRAAGLRWEYSLGLGGTVVDQRPHPGDRAPRDSTVRLSVNFL